MFIRHPGLKSDSWVGDFEVAIRGCRRDDLLSGDASLFQAHIDVVCPPDFSLFYGLPYEC